MSDVEPHKQALGEAIALEAEGHRRLIHGDHAGARDALGRAAERYRASWEAAGPTAYGRLIGLLKARLLSGDDATADARYVLAELRPDAAGESAVAAYAATMAALALGDDDGALATAPAMRTGSDAFMRTADALEALASRDQAGYDRAVAAIVADFEARDAHLTGVPIADTALMLDVLARPRGMARLPASAVLPVPQG